MIPIREHIIALIQRYIYTNGEGKITAAQLKEILLEITNAFAVNGGIDTVLQAGSVVSDGRVISNEKNGTFRLEAEAILGEITRKYVGFDVFDPTLVSVNYAGSDFITTGTIKRRDASRSIFDIFDGGLEKGEVAAFTVHNIEEKEPERLAARGSAPEPITNAQISSIVRELGNISYDRVEIGLVESSVKSGDYYSRHSLRTDGIGSEVNVENTNNQSSVWQYQDQMNYSVQTGPQTSRHIQRAINFETVVSNNGQDFSSVFSHFGVSWRDNFYNEIAKVNTYGVGIAQEKRLTVNQNGSAPTAGWAKLVAGTVNVTTSAVRSNSAISISVQEAGTYSGRIRVSSKTPNSGFSLSSSNDTDNCTVFWQIIDVE